MCTRRTRTGMARQLTRVRALSGPLFAAGLTARMWWQASKWTRLSLLFAPAGVRRWKGVFRQIATRTPPLPDGGHLTILLILLSHGRTSIRRPFLDAVDVEDGPTRVTRPDFAVAPDFTCADGTFVMAIIDVLVRASGDIRCLRFRHSSFRWSWVSRRFWLWLGLHDILNMLLAWHKYWGAALKTKLT